MGQLNLSNPSTCSTKKGDNTISNYEDSKQIAVFKKSRFKKVMMRLNKY